MFIVQEEVRSICINITTLITVATVLDVEIS